MVESNEEKNIDTTIIVHVVEHCIRKTAEMRECSIEEACSLVHRTWLLLLTSVLEQLNPGAETVILENLCIGLDVPLPSEEVKKPE